jgi:hypothetical protein
MSDWYSNRRSPGCESEGIFRHHLPAVTLQLAGGHKNLTRGVTEHSAFKFRNLN